MTLIDVGCPVCREKCRFCMEGGHPSEECNCLCNGHYFGIGHSKINLVRLTTGGRACLYCQEPEWAFAEAPVTARRVGFTAVVQRVLGR